MLEKALTGSRQYWWWVVLLLAIIGVGVVCYLQQWSYGLGITGMSRNVSWGLYISNFTFLVGVAASAVVLVLAYYLHNQREFKRIVPLGEFLAVAAVFMAILFILVDLGQPARAFNLILYPSPTSIIFWDMVVLTVYLVLSAVIAWTTLDAERKSELPPACVKPLILLSIPWAISIHTVTAFIYSGLGARPFWLTALMAPRFLASAFASGPAFLIIICLILRRLAKFEPGEEALQKTAKIATYAMVVNVFFLLVEFFTVFYSQVPEHMRHFQYLLFGVEGQSKLVSSIWISFTLALVALCLLLNPSTRRKDNILMVACLAVFGSIWIDKGLGLVVTGFVPSPTGELFEYWPTVPEALITLGVWAFGLLILTALYQIAVSMTKETAD